ncbi:hypothetical protein Hanom_Chr14g01327201 [Helianthus anomalus]
MAYFLSSLHLYIDAFRDSFKITSTHDLQNNFYPCFLCFFGSFKTNLDNLEGTKILKLGCS